MEKAEFFVPGRTELGGNHTDHQGGCVLADDIIFNETRESSKEWNINGEKMTIGVEKK